MKESEKLYGFVHCSNFDQKQAYCTLILELNVENFFLLLCNLMLLMSITLCSI